MLNFRRRDFRERFEFMHACMEGHVMMVKDRKFNVEHELRQFFLILCFYKTKTLQYRRKQICTE